jgi:hypothetical protein
LSMIGNVDHCFMMGCAFHPENMELLGCCRGTLCTCYGFTGPECDTIRKRYPPFALRNNNWKCLSLLRETGEFQECIA